MVVGVYFNSAYEEVLALASEEVAPPDAEGWDKVSDDAGLGLVAIRALLVENGLTANARAIEWHGMKVRSGRSAAFTTPTPDP